MERSDKSPFVKGGFRGNVYTRITKRGSRKSTPSFRDPVGEVGDSCLLQTFKVLCDLHQAYSHYTHEQIHRRSASREYGMLFCFRNAAFIVHFGNKMNKQDLINIT